MALPNPELLPAALARNTVAGLHAEFGPPRPWVYPTLIVLALGALAALPLVRVDVTDHAPGLVRAATERTDLRTAVAGRIARLWARDNAPVAAGEPVLELTSANLDERLAHNRARQQAARDLIHDLSHLSTTVVGVAVHHHQMTTAAVVDQFARTANAGRPFSPAAATGAVAAEASERAAAGDSLGIRNSEIAAPPSVSATARSALSPPLSSELRTPALQAELAELRAQLSAQAVTAARARTELERVTVLHDRGIAARRDLDDARFAVARAQAEAELLRQQSLTRWQSRLRGEQLALMALVSEEAHLGDERSSFTLRSPVAGTLLGLVGLAEGTWVAAGQVVASVSPAGRLVIEAAVPSHRIGFIREGQPVKIAVDTYAPTEWGTLAATTRSISADLQTPAAGTAPHYKVLIAPDQPALHRPDGTIAPLRKGMTVHARFQVARRSLLQLLYEDTSRSLDPRRLGGPGTAASPGA